MSPSAYRQLKLEKLKFKATQRSTNNAPAHWRDWLPALFPHLFYHPFASHHIEFWQFIDIIRPGVKPPAFFAIWPRGGAKSTNAEGAVVFLGAKDYRKFALYVRRTQDKANESVQNIGAMIEQGQVSRYYPKFSERRLGKYNNSKGWRVDTLRCANGFNVVALGLDAAVRGIKIEEYRPDLIILDDIDDKDDTLVSIDKKIHTLTDDILPAGSHDTAVIGIQNLIHYNSIFKQIVDGKADFLHNRIVSGPFPAVIDLEYEPKAEGGYKVIGGTPIWEGQNLKIVEDQINEWGPAAFLKESQQQVTPKEGRVFHGFTRPGPDVKELDLSQASGFYRAHDFGAVNEVFGLYAKIGSKYYLIHEQMLPEATTADRAKLINAACVGKNMVAGWGGAKGEKQVRLDYMEAGLSIRLPGITDVESQIDRANEMLKSDELIICANCVHTIDQAMNCIRDGQGKIVNESSMHYLAQLRYFAAGIARKGWAR